MKPKTPAPYVLDVELHYKKSLNGENGIPFERDRECVCFSVQIFVRMNYQMDSECVYIRKKPVYSYRFKYNPI